MAEPLSIIASIITLLDTAKRAYDTVQDATHLPQAFGKIRSHIDLATNTLFEIRHRYQNDTDEESKIRGTLQECAKDAEDVQQMYDAVCDVATSDWLHRYRGYVSNMVHDRKGKVEDRWRSLLEGLQVLQNYHLFRNVSTTAELAAAIRELQTVENSLSDDGANFYGPVGLAHTGSGENRASVWQTNTYAPSTLFQGGTHHHAPQERVETPPLPLSTIPLLPDPDYVSRHALLEELDTKASVPRARVAVVGLGGTGKTQLAVEYAAELRSRSPDMWVIWISANTAARVQQSATEVAERLKIRGRKDPKENILQLLKGWLDDKRNGKWLAVLDNMDDAGVLASSYARTKEIPRQLIEYLPVCEHGFVVITTRSKSVARQLVHARQVIDVPPMNVEHATMLLEKKLGLEDRQQHAKLAAALDSIPLAMAQAAAYICEREPRCSIAQYLHEVEESHQSRTSLLRRGVPLPDRDWEASSSVITTWQISFEHIYQTRRSAADLLSLMSLCDRQAIPEMLVHGVEGSSGWSEIDKNFEDDITMLRSFSFISTTTSPTDWTMHRLVQDATRVWIEDHGRLNMVQERFIGNLSAVFPSGSYENWHTCQVLLPHVQCATEQKPQSEAALLEWVSAMYRAAWYSLLVGDWDGAEDMAQRSLEERAKQIGKHDDRTVDSQAMVANVLRSKGRWTEAEKLEVEVMA